MLSNRRRHSMDKYFALHGDPEPPGCAACHHETPYVEGTPEWLRQPSRRYIVTVLGGNAVYTCRDEAACRQRSLARAEHEGDPDEGVADEERSTLNLPDAPGDAIAADLDDTDVDGFEGITSSIVRYQLARARLPRNWAEITTGPRDQRTCIAVLTASTALSNALKNEYLFHILAARKAGARWEAIAAATGDWDATTCREEFLADEIDPRDWPECDTAEVGRLTAADDPRPI